MNVFTSSESMEKISVLMRVAICDGYTCMWWYQVVMSFHQCGGNVGDDVNISLPEWVLKIADRNADIFFTNSSGAHNPECLSWGIDKIPVLQERTALQVNQFETKFCVFFRGWEKWVAYFFIVLNMDPLCFANKKNHHFTLIEVGSGCNLLKLGLKNWHVQMLLGRCIMSICWASDSKWRGFWLMEPSQRLRLGLVLVVSWGIPHMHKHRAGHSRVLGSFR